MLRLPDGATLEVLHAPDPLAHNALADDRVAVFRLHWRGWKILFTSDAGMGAELRMLDNLTDVAADVIIAGRHRTDLSLCDRFLDAVNPRAIITSNAPYPESEAVAPLAIGDPAAGDARDQQGKVHGSHAPDSQPEVPDSVGAGAGIIGREGPHVDAKGDAGDRGDDAEDRQDGDDDEPDAKAA
jgi:hypothetical protein